MQLQSYLGADSAVLISMNHFRNQNVQIGRMTRQIIDQDTTISSLRMANTKSTQEISNRDIIIREKDFQLTDKQGIIDGADLRLKNCRRAGWKRTWIGSGIGFGSGILLTTIAVVAVKR